MERTTVARRVKWWIGEAIEAIDETPRVRSLKLAVPGWAGHQPGQHVDVRLTAEDGYQAVRSYSIASAPEADHLMLTVERLDDGEVSTYLTEDLIPGDRIELLGPVGGFFVWDVNLGGPLNLFAGGSGIAPLMAMLRHRVATGSQVPTRLLYSSRTIGDIIYRRELDRIDAETPDVEVIHTLTRAQPDGWTGYARRVDIEMLREVTWPVALDPLIYICGPTSFVEAVSNNLLQLGYSPDRIRTERFGPTGVP